MVYAVADLHGYPFEKFTELLKKAGFCDSDYLFVLGDVIDRGKDGIKLLQWMSEQPNVELILGNHEDFMLKCAFIPDKDHKGRSMKESMLISNWERNGGIPTIEAAESLPPLELSYLINYLEEAPLYDTAEINGRDILFTHSGLGNFSVKKKLCDYTVTELIWNRPKISDRYFEDALVIFGHTPTLYYGEEYRGKIIKTDTWINIDAGAGYGFSPVLLRLDDMKEFTLD